MILSNSYEQIATKYNAALNEAMSLPEGEQRDAAIEEAVEDSYEATRDLEADIHFESTAYGDAGVAT